MKPQLLLISITIPALGFMVAAAQAQTSSPPAPPPQGIIRSIEFPVDGLVTYRDDFGEPRFGHTHEGNDLIGKKMMPLVAAVDGRINFITIPEAEYGYALSIRDAEGYEYRYFHINNDTPGTDDGMGGLENAFAPGIERGAFVVRGQLVGWMGDSGNAENVGPHLHFEIRLPDGTAVSPFKSLQNATHKGGYNPAAETNNSSTINDDKGLVAAPGLNPPCLSGSLIKSVSFPAVYYCGANGKRYVFPNEKTYFTWYTDFSGVIVISEESLAAVPIGGNVTYRPGVKMVKIPTDPKVYVVAKGGVLRWVTSVELAVAMYGTQWNKKLDDIIESFIVNYTYGANVTSTN